MSKSISIVIRLVFLCLLISSCNKDSVTTSFVNFYLTDLPSPCKEINIDIQSIELHPMGPYNKVDAKINKQNPGIYNILNYSNGKDTLLYSFETAVGVIKYCTIKFGDNNSIKIGDKVYPLILGPGLSKGLEVPINQLLEADKTRNIWIDFKASRCVQYVNDTFYLVPSIRVFNEDTGGTLVGVALPEEAKPFVIAYNDKDTLYTIAGAGGRFMIRAVPPGTYNVKFIPQNGKLERELKNFEVTDTIITDIGTIGLN